ncbi:MAG: hypothetical protein IPG64_22510 [Haliea sp.]|nr:hypothetical protein [Haliea sp.]MBK6740410.1 hypothetical protein [Haliea sp.]
MALQSALLVAAFSDPLEAESAWARWQSTSGWEQHVDFESYLLLPRVYHNLGGRGVDDALYQRLKGLVRRCWAANAAMRGVLGRVAQLFEADAIDAVVLPPGALLLHDHSAVLAPDTLLALEIDRRHASRTVAVLQSAGWCASVLSVPSWSFPGFIAASSHLKMTNAAGMQLELHWRDSLQTPYRDIVPTKIAGHPVGSLSTEASIQFLFIAPGMGNELARISRALLLLHAAPAGAAWHCLLRHLQERSSPFLHTVTALSGLPALQPAQAHTATFPPAPDTTDAMHTPSFARQLAVRWSHYRRLLGEGTSFEQSVRYLPGYLMGKWNLQYPHQLLPGIWRNLGYHWRRRKGYGA